MAIGLFLVFKLNECIIIFWCLSPEQNANELHFTCTPDNLKKVLFQERFEVILIAHRSKITILIKNVNEAVCVCVHEGHKIWGKIYVSHTFLSLSFNASLKSLFGLIHPHRKDWEENFIDTTR